MNPTSPTATVLDEVATWAGIHPQPTREAPPQSCSRATSSATFTLTAARSTFLSRRPTRATPRSRTGQEMVSRLGHQATREPCGCGRWDEDGITLLRESYDALRAPSASAAKSQS